MGQRIRTRLGRYDAALAAPSGGDDPPVWAADLGAVGAHRDAVREGKPEPAVDSLASLPRSARPADDWAGTKAQRSTVAEGAAADALYRGDRRLSRIHKRDARRGPKPTSFYGECRARAAVDARDQLRLAHERYREGMEAFAERPAAALAPERRCAKAPPRHSTNYPRSSRSPSAPPGEDKPRDRRPALISTPVGALNSLGNSDRSRKEIRSALSDAGAV